MFQAHILAVSGDWSGPVMARDYQDLGHLLETLERLNPIKVELEPYGPERPNYWYWTITLPGRRIAQGTFWDGHA